MRYIFLIFGIAGLMVTNGFADQPVKQPNVAGQFYPADAKYLSAQIQSFLKGQPPASSQKSPQMIIVPHAGYVYSGKIAACAFQKASAGKISTVILLAPSHHFGFPGLSVWSRGAMATPLGRLEVDEPLAQALIDQDDLFVDEPRAFDKEHSLEVQLPFIQEVFSSDVKIVPVIMGQADFLTCRKAAESLKRLIGERKDILIVISSDMSHFHDDATAREMDGRTLKLIESLDAQQLWNQCARRHLEMCGFVPVTTALLLAKMQGLVPEVLTYGNSGDITGDRSSVVGYGAVMFYAPPHDAAPERPGVAPLTLHQKRRLMQIAKETVNQYVRHQKILTVQEADPRLQAIEGAFVTLHKDGRLRGCIGHIVGQQPLYLTVRDMAVAASSEDPRFDPVRPEELHDLEFEISVLSQPHRVTDVAEIQMGRHGVIVKRGRRYGVFLPQVATETGWNRETFLSQLCAQKAGLAPDAWKDPATELDIFTATVFSERDLESGEQE